MSAYMSAFSNLNAPRFRPEDGRIIVFEIGTLPFSCQRINIREFREYIENCVLLDFFCFRRTLRKRSDARLVDAWIRFLIYAFIAYCYTRYIKWGKTIVAIFFVVAVRYGRIRVARLYGTLFRNFPDGWMGRRAKHHHRVQIKCEVEIIMSLFIKCG